MCVDVLSEESHILQLVSKCLKKDRRAQEALYKHFYPLMMPVCMSYAEQNDDAIDIYNRAFFKIFASIEKWSGTGPFGAWARRIIVNTAIDFLRKNKKCKLNQPIEDQHDVGVQNTIIEDLTSNEILELFRFLPPAQRLVLNLYIVEGKKHAEIAEELNISVGTSKWHLNQGRKLMQEKIYEFGILTR
ncbi:MAG: RNA polymerase sigma factor (sigma-70 family) [Bacteroidia bacterium]|jgi:RNA polymerase sigma factor (sigma-70 family)